MSYIIPILCKSKSWNTFISESLLTQSRDPFDNVNDFNENTKRKSSSLYEFKLYDNEIEKIKPTDNKKIYLTSSLFNTTMKS